MSDHGHDTHIHHHIHVEGLEAIVTALADHHVRHIVTLLQEIKSMSQSAQDTLDANNAAMTAALDAIQADVTAIASELQAATPPVGSVVSQATVDANTAIVSRLQAVKSALDGLAVPASGTTHTAEDTSDTTPNGSTRADGSVRNNFFLPNFNPANPETT